MNLITQGEGYDEAHRPNLHDREQRMTQSIAWIVSYQIDGDSNGTSCTYCNKRPKRLNCMYVLLA